MRRGGQGVAMITALLVVSLATTAVISLVSYQQLAVRRSELLLHGDQAWLYALGVEDWARSTLFRDRGKNDFDGHNDLWSTSLPETKVDGGRLQGRIEDLQGRFNLNSLVRQGTLHEKTVLQFRRLLTGLGIESSLIDTILAWIKAERLVSDAYQGNRFLPLTHESELLEVEGMTMEQYETMAPYLVVLPEPTAINVNNAPPPILAALHEQLSLEQADSIHKALQEKPAENLADAMAAFSVAEENALKDSIGISSRYFRVVADAEVAGIHQRLVSHLLRADSGETRSIYRSRNKYGE